MIRGLASVERARAAKPFEPIVRERLVERLARAAAYRITIVAAPAGFGKSVAIRQYLEAHAVESLRFGLRREHATLAAFVRGFVEALATVAPDAEHSVAGVCEFAERSATPAADCAAWLAVLLERYTGTVVVDDLHFAAADPRAIEVLREVIERSGERVRWLVACRDSSELPLASWLAYGNTDMPVDEVDLRLTPAEAAEAAIATSVRVTPAELGTLLELTGGWPTAFAFALRASLRTADLHRIAAGTREMVFAFLAEQVYRGLRDDDRRFLRESAVLPSLEVDLFEAAGRHDAVEAIARLRRTTAFIATEREGVYRYHDLFREFLEAQLRSEGGAAFAEATRAAAAFLERARRTLDALRLYVQAGAVEDVLRIACASGSDLLDRGFADALESAIAIVPIERGDDLPRLVGLQASLHAYRGRYDVAELLFEEARAATTDPEYGAELAHRQATLLLQRGRFAEAVAALRAVRGDRIGTASLRARFLATKASALSFAGEIGEASEYLAAALETFVPIDDGLVRALLLQHAAAVEFYAGHLTESQLHARASVATALDLRLYSVAARSATFLYLVAHEHADQAQCGLMLAQIERHADQAGDRAARWFATANGYDLAAERGDLEHLAELSVLLERDGTTDELFSNVALLPALALQAAWRGDFEGAQTTMTRMKSALNSPGRRALRAAQLMVYAAGAGNRADAEQAALEFGAAANAVAARDEGTARFSKARTLYALALVLLNRLSTCNNVLRGLETHTSRLPEAIVALVRAVRAVYVQVETTSGLGDIRLAFEALQRTGLGGYAKLIEALPLPDASSQTQFASLTRSELLVLQLIASGATSKSAAAHLGRSTLTVESHVKAILKKLHCTGRREAIALARERGIV